MLRRALVSTAVAATIVGTLLAPGSAAAAPPAAPCTFAPTAVPTTSAYDAADSSTPFSRPAPADHIGVLKAFSSISPATRTQNLAEAVATNQTATPATAAYAVRDNYGIEGPAIFNALGSRLTPAFYSALAAGQLPKTSKLLLGEESLIADRIGTSKEKKYFHYSRPFEVAPQLIRRYSDGRDLYADVAGTGSYPSGHTTWGYSQAFLIAQLLPELGPQILSRGAEYGYHRIVLGVHYPLDVIGGRMLAEADVAEMLGDPHFSGLVKEASAELRGVLAARVGGPIARVVRCQQPYQDTAAALAAYRQRASYSFVQAGPPRPAQIPAGAENLIRAAHPGASTAHLRGILARTALPAGSPLDSYGAGGGWERLDIAQAWVTR